MATSGSIDFNRTAQQIIRSAFRLLGIIQSGESPSADEEQDALEALNLMIKSWQSKGIHLWTYAEATLFLTVSQSSYTLSGSRAVSTYIETITTADASSSDTSITVNSISGISDGDVLGIVSSSTTIHWTTVNGTPSGSTINFDDALTVDISSGATVYAYTSSTNLINRPLRIESMRRRDVSGSDMIDTPMGEMGREDYFNLPIKSSTGRPVQFYYDPGRNAGILYIWPTADVITQLIVFTYLRTIEDFDSSSNDPDFPQEWLETLKYQLALRLAPEYGIEAKPIVVSMAEQLFDDLMNWDIEPTSVYFQP